MNVFAIHIVVLPRIGLLIAYSNQNRLFFRINIPSNEKNYGQENFLYPKYLPGYGRDNERSCSDELSCLVLLPLGILRQLAGLGDIAFVAAGILVRGGGIGRMSKLQASNESGDPMLSSIFSSFWASLLAIEDISLWSRVASVVSLVRS